MGTKQIHFHTHTHSQKRTFRSTHTPWVIEAVKLILQTPKADLKVSLIGDVRGTLCLRNEQLNDLPRPTAPYPCQSFGFGVSVCARRIIGLGRLSFSNIILHEYQQCLNFPRLYVRWPAIVGADSTRKQGRGWFANRIQMLQVCCCVRFCGYQWANTETEDPPIKGTLKKSHQLNIRIAKSLTLSSKMSSFKQSITF